METFGLLLEALEAPAVGLLRERQALKIWAGLHGVVMLAEQGLLTGQVAQISREELVEEIVRAEQAGAVGRDQGGWCVRAGAFILRSGVFAAIAKDGGSGSHGSRRAALPRSSP